MKDGTEGLGGTPLKGCTCDGRCHNAQGWSGECKCGCKVHTLEKAKCDKCNDSGEVLEKISDTESKLCNCDCKCA